MTKNILNTQDLNPDGVHIIVNWDKMVVGASVFIPCINTEEAVKQLTRVAADKKWEIKPKIQIENNNLGLRVWRTL